MPLFNNFHSARNQGQQGFSVEAVAYEAEFKELLHRFQDRHHETDFDPVAPFRRIVEILEWAMDDFYANNPDPLDQRHPHKIIPTCLYGHLLRFMLKFSDFLDKCLVSYIMPHHNNLELNILAARVLVMALPVIDSSVFSVDADVHQQLFRYALDSESRELRAYATAILNPAITPETAHVFRTEIVDLITKSLNSLKVLYAQMVENSTENSLNEGGTDRAAPTDFSQLAENLNKEQENGKTEKKTDSDDKAIKKDLDGKETKTDADGKVPDTSSSNSETEKSKENGQTGGNVETGKLRSGQKRTSDDAKLSVCEAALKKIKASGRRKSTPKNPGASTPLADFGEESRSSTVDEMKRVFVGNNKVYPLTIEMEQRMILGFLQCAFEFTDNVSVLTEHSALDVILKYLNVNEYHDIRLLFEALFALSSMLIHLRLAWDFVNRGGILRLITVNRNSVAAAAVCVCFHHISQFDEIMEHICQGSSKGVDDVVSYAIWQLAHGYESVGGRICVFFQYALRYKNVLERFDHRDGLRVLYNYANSKLNDFLYGDFEDNEVIEKIQEKMGEYCQVLRNTNVCLTQYILSHILLKYEHIKRMHADRFPSYLKKAVLAGKIPHKDLCKKPLIMDAETESKALEVLRYFIPATNLTFHPLTNIRSFGFITLYIRAMALRTEFYHHMSLLKSDVIQGILKIFQYATVSPAVVQDLATAISFPHGDRCGIR
ncbi:unnamed protein product [Bursaphelenchus okinawaensis]|uniref:Uncharacterized protein n=1 Tax=Bursaphelenchus okinawaensis TaxID=465554 RepID=A0A811L132_9BILA|nr:unnamed protein product [Bursaphelenchus okinawaensis]CAG9114595.1 unnamed protein product [Bursaphelenchus okinawaensis]